MSFIDVPPEILNLITQHLSIVDIMSLKFTCKYLSKINTNKIFNEKIKTLFDEEMLKLIDETNVVVSGSSMLRLLYDAEWKSNDIDIYESTKNDKLNSRYTCQNIEHFYEKNDLKFSSNLRKFGYHVSSRGKDSGCFATNYHEHPTKLTINMIYLNKVKPLTSINKTYDMDLVKVAYNKGKLYVKDWTKLITKSDYIMPMSLFVAFSYSKEKYLEKRLRMEELCKRREKYLDRSFKIYIHDDMSNILEELGKEIRDIKNEINPCGRESTLEAWDAVCQMINDPNFEGTNKYLKDFSRHFKEKDMSEQLQYDMHGLIGEIIEQEEKSKADISIEYRIKKLLIDLPKIQKLDEELHFAFEIIKEKHKEIDKSCLQNDINVLSFINDSICKMKPKYIKNLKKVLEVYKVHYNTNEGVDLRIKELIENSKTHWDVKTLKIEIDKIINEYIEHLKSVTEKKSKESRKKLKNYEKLSQEEIDEIALDFLETTGVKAVFAFTDDRCGIIPINNAVLKNKNWEELFKKRKMSTPENEERHSKLAGIYHYEKGASLCHHYWNGRIMSFREYKYFHETMSDSKIKERYEIYRKYACMLK